LPASPLKLPKVPASLLAEPPVAAVATSKRTAKAPSRTAPIVVDLRPSRRKA
jgi:hypothetical protein